jgi:hypothetical protein
MFVSLDQLPKSATDGPEDWTEAWARLATGTDQTQSIIENTNSDKTVLEGIYDRRIEKIESLTGERLANPIRTAPLERRALYSRTGMPILFSLPRDAYEGPEDAFNQRVNGLIERFPQVNAIIGESVTDEKNRLAREAESEASKAARSPALGTVGRFTAQLAGGLMGASKDPFQWQVTGIGGGAATGKTVAGRIGQTMFSEFLINGGSEAVLQAASQERKRAAGLEHGLGDALKNVGIAGTFGALFGGTVQGGAEVARIFKLGEGGAERATRILEGRPERGDVETFAAETGITIAPDELSQISRSFEERTLDEIMVPENATPDDITLMTAAMRHAEDPDNFPPPDLVERALAESAGESRTLSADDYQRIYDGDEAAVDNYRSTVAASANGSVDLADTFGDVSPAGSRVAGFTTEKGSRYAVNRDGTTVRNKAARSDVGHEGDRGIKPVTERTVYVDENAATLSAAGLQGLGSKGARVVIKDGKASLVTWNKKANGWGASPGSRDIPVFDAPAVGRYPLELWTSVDDVPGFSAYSKMHAGNKIVAMIDEPPLDPIRDQRIRPQEHAEPFDQAAVAKAEVLAGDIIDPKLDGNGHVISMYEMLPFEDGNGNRTPIMISQALEIADEPNFHADLLEACKL